jgi:hypothetical protein
MTLITYESNGVVFIQTAPQRFDTIANFNANIGEGWYTFGWDSADCSPKIPLRKIVVYDTSHVIINGQNLKRLRISPVASSIDKYIVEKIGPLQGFMHDYYWDCYVANDSWPFLGDFSCYKDDNFPVYSRPGVSNCEYVGITQIANRSLEAVLYPNPNSGEFKIIFAGPASLTITNVSGKLVYEQFLKGPDEHIIKTVGLQPGFYHINLHSETHTVNSKLFIQ